MFDSFFKNTVKPTKTLGGRIMLNMMNRGHAPMAKWGLGLAKLPTEGDFLDIGCGGGQNIKNYAKQTSGKVCGVDYSEASCEKSRELNREEISTGRIEVTQASVEHLPYDDNRFSCCTALETLFFWPDPVENLREVLRVLQPGGLFALVHEESDPVRGKRWVDMLGMVIYTPEELRELLQKAGFTDVEVVLHKNGRWVAAWGRKPR